MVAGALALAIAFPGGLARAQSNAADKAAAEALFDQGRKLLADGKYAEACKKLEQSQHIDPGIGTLLYLADCYEKSGRTASAWATYRQAASEARAEGQEARAGVGSDRAAALEPKLSKLTINVSSAARGLTGLLVKRGTDTVRPGLFGVPVPVDPGMVAIEASAPGYTTWKKSVKVGDQADKVQVSVPALEKAPATAPAAPPEQTPPPTPTPTPAPTPAPAPRADTGSPGSTQRTLGLIAGGVGLVGIGVGSVFGVQAIQKNNDAKKICPDNVCSSQRGLTLTDDAKRAATISDIAIGAGAAVLAAGVVLYLTAPRKRNAVLRLQPSIGRAGGGVSLGGRF